jgi:hypothetical protein
MMIRCRPKDPRCRLRAARRTDLRLRNDPVVALPAGRLPEKARETGDTTERNYETGSGLRRLNSYNA